MLGLAPCGEPAIAAMESLLRVPGAINDDGRGPALALPQGITEKGMMPIVPGGFDEDASQMRVAGLGDVAAGLFRPAGVLGMQTW